MVKNRLIIPTCIPVNFMVKYKSIWTQVCLIAWPKIISILRTVTLQMNTAYDARLGTRHHTPNSTGPLRHFAIPAADEDHDGEYYWQRAVRANENEPPRLFAEERFDYSDYELQHLHDCLVCGALVMQYE